MRYIAITDIHGELKKLVCAACGRKPYEVFLRMGLTGEGSGGKTLTNER